ncbi:MAG: hypothetical protein ACRCWG_04170 [Sarcina sp.]
MGNSGFAKRYLCQELLKVAIIVILVGVIGRVLSVKGLDIIIVMVALFFTTSKVVCAVKYFDRDRYHKMPKVGFLWRFKGSKGQKLSDMEIDKKCGAEKNFNVIILILLGCGFVGGRIILEGVVLFLAVYFIVHPKAYTFLDKNFGTYYKFRGECTGVITVDIKHSEPLYYVSVVSYKTKEELVVEVPYKVMRNFNKGQILDVVYGKISKSAISIV